MLRAIQENTYKLHGPLFVFPPKLGQGLWRMSFERYLDSVLVPHNSFYKAFSITPAHGVAYIRSQQEARTPQSQANLDFGSAWHTAMLEPNNFETTVVLDEKELNRNTKEFKKWKAEQGSKIILKQKDVDKINWMRDVAYSKSFVREILEAPGHAELTGIYKEPDFPSLWAKVRVDKALDDGYIIDLKSAVSAGRDGFRRAIWNYSYNLQAALYIRAMTVITGHQFRRFAWLVQEKVPPFECRLEGADPGEMDEAQDRLNMMMTDLEKCLKENYFPGYREQQGWKDVFPDTDSWDSEAFKNLEEDGLPW